MPPKRRIIVDPDDILRAILAAVPARIEALEAELSGRSSWDSGGLIRFDLRETREGWIPYDLKVFSGRDDLTPSEKQRWRQAVLDLEHRGLVEIRGQKATALRLTDAGKRRLTEFADELEALAVKIDSESSA